MKSFAEPLEVADREFRLVFGRTRIRHDPEKEMLNRRDHGYSLESAVVLLERLVIAGVTGKRIPFVTSDGFLEHNEVRHMHMAVDEGKVVFFVTTMREDEMVRVISFRRAHQKERVEFLRLTGYLEPSKACVVCQS